MSASEVPADVTPDLDELLQLESAKFTVPVRHDGPLEVHELPSRVAVVSDFGVTTTWQRVLGADLKRKRVTIVGDQAWVVSHGPFGGGTWPANVPLVWCSASQVFAKVGTGTATLTIINEEWAD